MAVHGDITEITYSHPTIGSGVFFPKSAEGNTYDPGGIRNSDDANAIAGDGSLIVTKNRVAGFFEVMIEDDMNVRGDALILAQLAADTVAADYTFSVINGSVFACSGIPVGDINPDVNSGTFTLKIVSGNIEKIA